MAVISGEDSLVGRTLLGKLRVLRPLGAGGMGAVYEVEHIVTGHRRALKVLHPGTADGEVLARFAREARVSALVRNSHVVETFDAGATEDGTFYVLMEMLEGRPLSRLFAERGRVPRELVLELFEEVCEGIAAAHDVGIVHRDLKPDNLFLVRDAQGREHVKILDFGISKFTAHSTGAFDGTLTNEGAMMGTPYYMSPEQVRALKDIDTRCDVYALGVMLYEALSGQRPFDATTFTALVVKIHDGDCEPLASVAPDLEPALVATVERAMHKDRAKRFATVRDLASALRECRVSSDPDARPSWADSGRLVHTFARGRETHAPPPQPAKPSRLGWIIGAVLGGLVVLGVGVTASIGLIADTSEGTEVDLVETPATPTTAVRSLVEPAQTSDETRTAVNRVQVARDEPGVGVAPTARDLEPERPTVSADTDAGIALVPERRGSPVRSSPPARVSPTPSRPGQAARPRPGGPSVDRADPYRK